MLLRFRVDNVRSLYNPAEEAQELNLVADRAPEYSTVPVTWAGRAHRMVPVAGIFGGNGSGKTNALLALEDMRRAVLDSCGRWTGLETIPREPFAFTADPKPSFYEVDLLLDGVRWTYGFELGKSRVEAEWLYSYDSGRRRTWVCRDATRPDCVYRWPGSRVVKRRLLADLTRDNALLLSVAGAMGHPQLVPLFRWFADNLHLSAPTTEREQRHTHDVLREDAGLRHRLSVLVEAADLGVCGFKVDSITGGLRLAHRTAGRVRLLDWEVQSPGTRTVISVLLRAIEALDGGRVLLLDDLGAGLHPRLTAEIVRLFTAPHTNTRHAQLVFSSNAATLLGTSVGGTLDPCHVWLTEKNDGATELYPLTAVSLGKDEDVRSSYLTGAFGGVPQFTQGRIGRALLAADAVTD
ncbi:AAA family ATPase [Streptomyces rhizosphaericus]|uniref:AAA family ATPase n=2 Tax=Streptomyces rhizosphaericus TaxID=114699 RepID=UPI000A3A11D7|nr:ATP-binding protein [Streptomyces rhizosphaericus]